MPQHIEHKGSLRDELRALRAKGGGSRVASQEAIPAFEEDFDISDIPAAEEDPGSVIGSVLSSLQQAGVGAAKGAGETAFELGRTVRAVPGLGSITDAIAKLIGPEGTDPEAAFAHVPAELEAVGPAQQAGKVAEQITEYLVPAGAARKAAIWGLARMIPSAASPRSMSIMNRLAAVLGRTGGEAGSAAGVSALHGADPDAPAAIAAIGPLLAEGIAKAAPLTQSSLVQQIAAVGGGAMAGGALGGPLGGGLAAFTATQPAVRAMIRNILRRPEIVQRIRASARAGVPVAMRLLAALQAEAGGLVEPGTPEISEGPIE